jgi:thiol:disulfide interchange protein
MARPKRFELLTLTGLTPCQLERLALMLAMILSTAVRISFRRAGRLAFSYWIVVLGAFWLGALLGTLLGFYVQEAEEWDQRALAASIWVIAGSSVLLLLQFLVPSSGAREIWFYPIGLVGGFIIGTIWEYADPPPK